MLMKGPRHTRHLTSLARRAMRVAMAMAGWLAGKIRGATCDTTMGSSLVASFHQFALLLLDWQAGRLAGWRAVLRRGDASTSTLSTDRPWVPNLLHHSTKPYLPLERGLVEPLYGEPRHRRLALHEPDSCRRWLRPAQLRVTLSGLVRPGGRCFAAPTSPHARHPGTS